MEICRILNETLVLNGSLRTLVGIMPPRFGWYTADMLIPTKLSRDAIRDPSGVLVSAGTPEAGRVESSKRRRS